MKWIKYLFRKKEKTFLVSYESGKNKIGGMDLHIIKSSRIIKAKSIDEAKENAFKTEYPYRYKHYHFGYDPDYMKITDIKKL